MRWISATVSRLGSPGLGLIVLAAAALAGSRLAGVETTERQPIRIAGRSEQNDLDPSIEETPPLPSADEPQQPPVTPSAADRAGHEATPRRGDVWPQPLSLLDQLDKLGGDEPASGQWAGLVRRELDSLHALPGIDDPQSAAVLSRLERLANEARNLAPQLTTEDSRSRLLRAGFAVVRRLAVWNPAHQAARSAPAQIDRAAFAAARGNLIAAAAAVEAELPRTGVPQSWHDYLLLSHLRQELNQGADGEALRVVAREILYRLHSTQLSQVQSEFLRGPAFANLDAALRPLAHEPADLAEILAAVEDYEQQEEAAAAIRLADHYDRLRWSSDPHVAGLSAAINTYYRNANVRVAISGELVNRLLPGVQATSEPVVDTIQGARVHGVSETSTKVRLVLLPTRGRWEIGLEAVGDVESSTTSSAGPARFHQWGLSNFRARKRLTVDRRGIRLFQAEAEANSDAQLNDFETEFDGIPLLGSLVRVFARNQYEQKLPAAQQEVEGKISYRASAELDQKVADKLAKAKQDFQQQLVQPLQKLNLEPTAVDMETTAERLIARYRLAGRDQLSAYTPRPQAPGDSLLSVQIHESALNNVLAHLKLEGRRVDLITLFTEMNKRFAGQPTDVPEDIPDDVFITFADHDPVRIDCEEGRVRLTIRLAAIERADGDGWENLTVVARYKPDSDQLDANLVRDGIIELPGRHLRTGDRAALSAIFGKVLSRNRKLNLINERISKSPQLGDQQVTQFVIHDGWIGVALGPKTIERQAQAARQTPK